MAVIEAALDKYEAIYEEKFPSEQPLLEVKKKKKTPGSRVMFGGVESNFEETEEEMLRSQTDVAVAAAFALMKEVNARDIDAPATPRRSNSPRTNTSLKDLTIITPDQKEPKGKSPLSQERGKSPLSQIVPEVIADGDSDDAIENSGNPKGIIVSNENSKESSPPPLEAAVLKLDSAEERRKSSAIVSRGCRLDTKYCKAKVRSIRNVWRKSYGRLASSIFAWGWSYSLKWILGGPTITNWITI
ncbi:hypothetical protein BDR26DRAFT_236972 [Obelidium mucronatum]|nr:hypothetical protein BDR26DRAFT_236972 [Obelidium mucronatum]